MPVELPYVAGEWFGRGFGDLVVFVGVCRCKSRALMIV